MEDSNIIELYWERNDDAISESAKRYGRYCKKIANNILHSREDADECVNDTWLGAWNAIPPHRPNNLSTFLGKITRNLSYNKYKSMYADKRGGGELPVVLDELYECIPSPSSVENEVEAAELEKTINQFLHSLAQLTCNIFLRRYWFAESIPEIAGRYAMTQSNVRMVLSRTRSKLKCYLEKEGIGI